jgi:hypothetical protein
MREAIQRYVLAHWDALGLGPPRPARLETLQLSNSAGQTYQHGGIIHLLFIPGERAPVLCAKVRWDPAARGALEREHRALQALARMMGDAVPRSYGIHQVAGRAVLFQEAAAGPSMATAVGRAYFSPGDCPTPFAALVRAHAGRVAAVLERLWSVPSEIGVGAGLPRLDIAGIVQRYVQEIEPDGAGRTQVERLGTEAQRLVQGLPPRLVHGDVQPYNFFLAGARTCLIDWEYAAAGDTWFVDPCRYVYYALHVLLDLGALQAADVTVAFSETFLERRTWFAPIATEFLLRCLEPAVRDYREAVPLLAVSLMYGCLLRRDCEYAADWGFTEQFRAQVQRCAEAYWADAIPTAPVPAPMLVAERQWRGEPEGSYAEVKRLQRLLGEQVQWNLALQRTVEEQAAEITRLQRLLDEQTAWAQHTSQEVAQRDTLIQDFQARLGEQVQWNLALQRTVEEQAAEITRLQRLLDEQTAWAQHTSADVAVRDATIRDLQAQLAEQTAEAARLRVVLADTLGELRAVQSSCVYQAFSFIQRGMQGLRGKSPST